MSIHENDPQHTEVIHANKIPVEESALLRDLSITVTAQKPARYRDLPDSNSCIVHIRPPEYAQVQPPVSTLRAWAIPFADYHPLPALPASEGSIPGNVEREALKNQSSICSHEGPLQFDTAQRPLNPIGRTGLSGKGKLYFWGPNHAADALLLHTSNTGIQEVLLIQRSDRSWALPGGFIDPHEPALHAAVRELGEEAIANIELCKDTFYTMARCMYQGYTADGRNTDHAWIETSVYMLTIETILKERLQIIARDDAQAVRWMEITPELLNSLYSDHGKFIRLAIEQSSKNTKIHTD